MKDLHVEIPKKFEDELRERFDLRKGKKVGNKFVIERECPLCDAFFACRGCPFARFESNKGSVGCIIWQRQFKHSKSFLMRNIILLEVRDTKGFKKWKRIAKRYIKFV